MLAPVLVILPSKLIKKSKIFDFLVNLEGKMTSTGASIYLDLGCQKHAGMFSIVMQGNECILLYFSYENGSF